MISRDDGAAMTRRDDGVGTTRWAWARVDLDAVRHNVDVLRRAVAPSAVWVVVKADGYGHGACRVAHAALAAGADGLCVALTAEGVELRRGGVQAPVLVLSEQPPPDVDELVAHNLIPTVYTADYVAAIAARRRRGVGVHVKVDTGMQRVGASPGDVPALLDAIGGLDPWVRVDGIFTHLAMADEPADPATDRQLDAFDAVLADIDDVQFVHAANSAGALAHPRARRSFVRAGIAVYGISPGPGVDHLAAELRPAMSLSARVSYVKRVAAGSRISYGLRHTFEHDTTVATVPIGYADGVPRRLSGSGASVLVGGERRPIVGVVTMDQLMVDVGDAGVAIGDEVVLLGRQGAAEVRADEWAARTGTIGYEIVCGVSGRVPRVTAP
jgi:alanine racemase